MSFFFCSYSSLPISPRAYRLSRMSLADSELPFPDESPAVRENGPHIIIPGRPRIMKKHKANIMIIMAMGNIHHQPNPQQKPWYPHI